MKVFLLFSLLAVIASPALRAEDSKEGFESHKSKVLAEIDERIAHAQKARACVAAATDRDGLKKCREERQEWRKEQKEERRERREKREERRKH